MRATFVLLVASLCLPTVLAAPPFVEVYEGRASSLLLHVNRVVCRDVGDATLLVEREMERATFTVLVQAECVPALVLRGALTHEGWSFEEPTGTAHGTFRPTGDGSWELHAHVDDCPPGFICEFTSGAYIDGTFRGPVQVV